jgi:telomerase reverse transcriptase
MLTSWELPFLGFMTFSSVFRFFKSQHGGNGPWFFVKVDAKAAFDSIRQDVLCRILSQGNIFSHERYCLQRYRVNGKLKTRVIPASDFSPLKPDTRRSGGGAIVTDCAWGEFVSRKELYDLLFEHIRLNVVQWQGQRFRQKVGIAQGSVLSSFLCSIYYGHMEHALGLITTRLPGLLMRWTDDTIFITRDLDAARTFLHQIQNDSVEYGLVLGSDKGCSNVPLAGLKCRDDGHFAWCGLLFDTRTLEVSWDYARYEGTRISDTLTSGSSASLLDKLKQYVSVKCIAVLTGLEINSYDTVLLNVYQMFLYLAMKFHCLGAAGGFRVISELIAFVSLRLRHVHPHPVHYLGNARISCHLVA